MSHLHEIQVALEVDPSPTVPQSSSSCVPIHEEDLPDVDQKKAFSVQMRKRKPSSDTAALGKEMHINKIKLLSVHFTLWFRQPSDVPLTIPSGLKAPIKKRSSGARR